MSVTATAEQALRLPPPHGGRAEACSDLVRRPPWRPGTQVQMVAWFSTTGKGMRDASWQPAGTDWPGSQTGPDASHGCLHVPPTAETTLFSWVELGRPVVVTPGDGSSLSAQLVQQSVDAIGNPITGAVGD